ncbi:MAG: arsenite/tail-anchored protein-transporting ATPase, partial [Actinomycetota bacterium]|nr:arsenite/tail-anchored protein-transporting ATPase [Actinomycetota bacterium]
DVKTHVDSGAYDVLVVDCAPTAETLRLLSLPEVMNWYIERIFPVERRVVKAVRPIVSKMTTLPIAGDQVFGAIERLHRNLEAVKHILTDEEVSSVRLVLNPEKMVIAEARRTYTYLGLFGYRVDAVIVNRVLPPDVTDPYFGKWKDIQTEHLATIHESFEPVPILEARLFDREMVGVGLLEEMGAEVYGDMDAASILYRDDPIRVRKKGTGYILSMRLPFVSRDDMDIHRRGEELFVRVGSYKRNLVLPQTLKRMTVRGAAFEGDHLEIVFGREPRPGEVDDNSPEKKTRKERKRDG